MCQEKLSKLKKTEKRNKEKLSKLKKTEKRNKQTNKKPSVISSNLLSMYLESQVRAEKYV